MVDPTASEWIFSAIKDRRSCRAFTSTPIEAQLLDGLRLTCATPIATPLGHQPRLGVLVAFDPLSSGDQRLGTYGVIRGAHTFIGGVVPIDNSQSLVDFGYAMQRCVLWATHHGLATCWLGATFRRGAFTQALGATEQECVPATSPVGYAREKSTLLDATMRWAAGSKHRKPWSLLFFTGDFQTPLHEKEAGRYAAALEMLRLAPSASNLQPWRVLRASDGAWHFYVQRSSQILRMSGIDLQLIDLGIAMYHFQGAAQALGLEGTWLRDHTPQPEVSLPKRTRYIATWQPA